MTLGTRSIQRIIMESLLLAEAKHAGIGCIVCGATEHYVREAQQMLEGAERAITQI
jgi:hypothetical protein